MSAAAQRPSAMPFHRYEPYPFGAALHVSGHDAAALERAIAPYREPSGGYVWRRGEPSLEDVFIHLMAGTRDNFR